VHKSPVLHIHELLYIWPKSYIFYGLHLLSRRTKTTKTKQFLWRCSIHDNYE
jgi:hypothetical protein